MTAACLVTTVLKLFHASSSAVSKAFVADTMIMEDSVLKDLKEGLESEEMFD